MAEHTINWGILSTGAIAKAFAHGLTEASTGKLTAVGSRSRQAADEFGEAHDVPRKGRHASYEALLADEHVQAIYIATPHPMHAEWAIKAAQAGKAVLCEKPMGLNHAQAMAMFDAARRQGSFMMEAFMYRCHPQTAKLVELIGHGAIGEVRLIRASFGFHGPNHPEHRLLNPELGGGGILDVGCYPVSISRLIAGAAAAPAQVNSDTNSGADENARPFVDPVDVQGQAHLGETGVDEWASAVVKFPGDIVAQLATAVRCNLDNRVQIFGSQGRIEMDDPWTHSRFAPAPGQITLSPKGGEAQQIDVPAQVTSFAYEADAAGRAILAGRSEPESPAMTWDDTLGNLKTLDQWRSGIGLNYPQESPEYQPKRTHAANRPLQRQPHHHMPYGKVPALDKPVSKLLMGCDNQRAYPHAAVMWDDWFERGGNAFDTGVIYGGGRPEKLLGQWVNARGVREDIVILSKVGHTPRCYPEMMVEDFEKVLNHLQTDHVELLVMHRDNFEVPVGEFIDTLNQLKDQGMVEAFGGSNWTFDRFEQANEYARQNHKQPMSVLSNNLCLAEMVDPVWADCLHISDLESLAWHERTQTPNFAWSSQARGFFTDRSAPEKVGIDPMLERPWYSEKNFARKQRAQQLAAQLGVKPINIAAAYVLNQPFPSFALIGPRTLKETTTSLPALDIELSREQRHWLWTGQER